jgi:hypothetical protein
VGEVAGAAADVQDAFTILGREQFDHVFAEFEHEVVFVVV